jgi:hypothetical protein
MLGHIGEAVFGAGTSIASTIVVGVGVIVLLLGLVWLAFYLSGPDRSGT